MQWISGCTKGQAWLPGGGCGLVRRALALLALLALPVWAQQAPVQWGQRLVQTIDVPPAVLGHLQAASAGAGASGGDKKAQADSLWRSQPMALTTDGSPYTVVVKVRGNTLADGDAQASLRLAWQLDGNVHPLMLPAIKQAAARAGQTLELTGASIPVTMKQDREALLRIESGSADNLQLSQVQIEIWSGMGNVAMSNPLLSWVPLLLGLFFVAFMVWMRRQ